MRRVILTAAALLTVCGCVSGPLADNPTLVRPAGAGCDNAVLVSPGHPGPDAYAQVFERVLDVLDDYFVVKYNSRYDGHIVCYPRIAPGLEQPWKPGSPDLRERLYATLQTVRHVAEVYIQPADQGGYWVQVIVAKELEDLPRPTRSTAGGAAFRSDPTVERTFEVIDPSTPLRAPGELPFIPKGRDTALEQAILRRIQECF
jgi:hypothetical protein